MKKLLLNGNSFHLLSKTEEIFLSKKWWWCYQETGLFSAATSLPNNFGAGTTKFSTDFLRFSCT